MLVFLCATSGIPHELWTTVLLICYVDTDSVAALLMRLRLRQRSPSTKSMTTNPSVSQKNSVHYANPDPATTTAVFNSIVSTCRDCVSAQNAFVAMAELERLKKKKKILAVMSCLFL